MFRFHILLRRKNKILIPESKSNVYYNNKNLALAMMKNVESLGFTFSKELLKKLSAIDKSELEVINKEMITCLKKKCGADKVYNPMYPNFPEQVIEASEAELFINAIIHYMSYGELMPMYKKDDRFPLIWDHNLIVLNVGTEDEVWKIFENLLSSKKSISEQDKNDIKTMIIEGGDKYKDHLPDEIPLKENIAFLCGTLKEYGKLDSTIGKYFKTATDVLRLITQMSDGDTSLSKNTRYKKMKRSDRRFYMNLLVGCKNLEEDMFRYKNKWIRIGEIIHPSEFKKQKYDKVRAAFNSIRSGKKPLFFAGKVQGYIQAGDIKKATKLLSKRPGDFARSLDKLLRETKNPSFIVNEFRNVADKISTNVLLDLRQHFIHRNDDKLRVVIPKGITSKAHTIDKQKKFVPEYICSDIAEICEEEILTRNREKEKMGNVYIDESFKKYIAPFSQRSASATSKTLERGSRIKLEDDIKILRGFIWWTNTLLTNTLADRVDLDLTASIFDDNWSYVSVVSWRNIKNDIMVMSGDITNGGDPDGSGVAEFLDVNLEKIKSYKKYAKYRYLVFTIHSFTKQKFSEIPNVRFGWMRRNNLGSGEIFEPKTVEVNMDVNANGVVAIPVIFDIKENEFIWCDLVSGQNIHMQNTLQNNIHGVVASCYATTNINKISLYDLIALNAKARGKLVKDRNKADIIFDNDTTKPITNISVNGTIENYKHEDETIPIITAYDTEYYLSEMM